MNTQAVAQASACVLRKASNLRRIGNSSMAIRPPPSVSLLIEMPSRIIPLLWLCSLIPAQAQTLGSCPLFPSNNVWNTPVDKLPVHPKSAAYVNSIGASSSGHADFGAGLYQGAPIGIPFITVPGSQAKVAVTFQ